MFRAALTSALLIGLAACTSPARDTVGERPGEPVRMGSAYPKALVTIPVDDPKTKAIAGALFAPNGPGPFPAVIVLSGCAGVDADAGVVRRLNADYMSKGIVTLVIDSLTPRGLTEVCSSTKLLTDSIAFRVRDAYAAVAWLAARPEIAPNRIFLQGYSHGAQTAIAAVDNQWPARNLNHIAGVIAYYPYCLPGSRISAPTIILIGEKDDWTPAQACSDISDKTNVEVTVYPNAFHAFAAPGVDLVYLGHRLLWDPAATADGQRRAMTLIQSRGR